MLQVLLSLCQEFDISEKICVSFGRDSFSVAAALAAFHYHHYHSTVSVAGHFSLVEHHCSTGADLHSHFTV